MTYRTAFYLEIQYFGEKIQHVSPSAAVFQRCPYVPYDPPLPLIRYRPSSLEQRSRM